MAVYNRVDSITTENKSSPDTKVMESVPIDVIVSSFSELLNNNNEEEVEEDKENANEQINSYGELTNIGNKIIERLDVIATKVDKDFVPTNNDISSNISPMDQLLQSRSLDTNNTELLSTKVNNNLIADTENKSKPVIQNEENTEIKSSLKSLGVDTSALLKSHKSFRDDFSVVSKDIQQRFERFAIASSVIFLGVPKLFDTIDDIRITVKDRFEGFGTVVKEALSPESPNNIITRISDFFDIKLQQIASSMSESSNAGLSTIGKALYKQLGGSAIELDKDTINQIQTLVEEQGFQFKTPLAVGDVKSTEEIIQSIDFASREKEGVQNLYNNVSSLYQQGRTSEAEKLIKDFYAESKNKGWDFFEQELNPALFAGLQQEFTHVTDAIGTPEEQQQIYDLSKQYSETKTLLKTAPKENKRELKNQLKEIENQIALIFTRNKEEAGARGQGIDVEQMTSLTTEGYIDEVVNYANQFKELSDKGDMIGALNVYREMFQEYGPELGTGFNINADAFRNTDEALYLMTQGEDWAPGLQKQLVPFFLRSVESYDKTYGLDNYQDYDQMIFVRSELERQIEESEGEKRLATERVRQQHQQAGQDYRKQLEGDIVRDNLALGKISAKEWELKKSKDPTLLPRLEEEGYHDAIQSIGENKWSQLEYASAESIAADRQFAVDAAGIGINVNELPDKTRAAVESYVKPEVTPESLFQQPEKSGIFVYDFVKNLKETLPKINAEGNRFTVPQQIQQNPENTRDVIVENNLELPTPDVGSKTTAR